MDWVYKILESMISVYIIVQGVKWLHKIVESIINERVNEAVRDASIQHAGYIVHYKGNVRELEDCVGDLKGERKKVKQQVDVARNNLEEIYETVEVWCKKVDEKIEQVDVFLSNEVGKKPGYYWTLLPYLWYWHRLGREAKKMAADVKSLTDKGSKFGVVSDRQNPTFIDDALPDYQEFPSRKDTMEKIMAKLKDPTVRMIGVHGPGGVGKTTFVKAIAKKAREMLLFDVVVTVSITNNPNPQTIQQDIADLLGLRFEGEGETGRADRLRKRLKQEKENTLVILEDLWDGLDLNKLGIPVDSKDDDGLGSNTVKKEKSAGDYKGCKILLTSRIKAVLSDKMDVKDESIFSVRELENEEAVTLFKKVAEISGENSKFKPEIVREYCAGLPIAIVTVGRVLKNKSESVWEDALEKLKKQELSGVQKSMEFSVKMSYDHLESEELKSIFLLCARLGHQSLIMDLVKYCFGLGILTGVHTLRDARDRIYASIQKLKDSSLMLDGNSSDHFNMHDMVQDAALSIARREQNVFTLRNDKLDELPDKEELERCTAISIHNCDIIDELPKVIHCPQLKFFLIDSDDPYLKIPENFFEGMEKLRVLILSGFHLPCLPSSIKCLSNLRMLCLERCVLGDNLSIIGELKKLRILSFSESHIKKFPAMLECLGKLQLLDISDCSIDKVIPRNLISGLTSLEELYIRKSLIKMGEGETRQSQISILSELNHLHQLNIIDLWIPNDAVLPRNLFFDKLNDYKIVIGDFKMLSIGDFKMPKKYEASRSLALQMKNGSEIHSKKGMKMMFKRVENLLLGELYGVQNVFYELNLDGFPDLKHLSIVNNLGIEYVINSMEFSLPQKAFPKLESLCLYDLRNIKVICCSPVTDDSFKKLKTIKVGMCPQLNNLFSFYIVKFLPSLETIDVSECDSLEEIVVNEGQVNTEKVEFRKLRSLTLQSLSSFTSFYSNGKVLSVPQLIDGQAIKKDQGEITVADDEHGVTASLSLFSELVEIPNLESLKLSSINVQKIQSDQPLSNSCFQNLIKLTVEGCHNLRYLCSLSVASSLEKLKGLYVSECRMMEKIFITEGNSVDYSKVHIFPKLEEIQLTYVDGLTDIWQAEVSEDSFSSLVTVQIVGCHKLDKIFPSHMIGRVGNLDSLKVGFCDSVEVIFEVKEPTQRDASGIDTKLRLIHLEGLGNLKQVWSREPRGILNFKNLRSVRVSECGKLSNVLPASVANHLEKLEDLSVLVCDDMEEIAAWEGPETSDNRIVFPEVTLMKFYGLPKMKRFYMGRHTVECPNLKRLAVNDCENLETFTTEATNEEGKPVFSAEKVISKLEYLEIGSKEANWLQSNIREYRIHHLKELRLNELLNIEILYWFLHRIPNLERLNLNDLDPDIKELVPSGNISPQERLGTVLQLKELTLGHSYIEDIGFDRDPVLQRVERLVLSWCRNLINFAHYSVSFTHLTYLEVYGCERLKNLMASSTAKSLVQLTTMKVIDCDMIKEIVTNEANEEDTVVPIIFSKLITLELMKLKNLTSFCSYEKCEFKFPSLEKLVVIGCRRMKTFTESRTIAPKLQNLLAVEGEEEQKLDREGDLNATIQKVFEDKIAELARSEDLSLVDHPELQEVWHGSVPLPERCFSNLKSLDVVGCEFLTVVLRSNLLPFLTKLERLEVRNCSSVKTIFDVKCIKDRKMINMEPARLPLPFSLKALTLKQLPSLENVWNEDPHGVIRVQLLQEVCVETCICLTSLFPASVAKDLVKLENLDVKHSEGLMAIVAADEAAPKGTPQDEIIFGQLQMLNLEGLPNLISFYKRSFTLSFPSLKRLSVINCHRMEIFFPGTMKDAIPLEVDPNSTVTKAYHGNGQSNELSESKVDSQEIAVLARDSQHLSLENHPELQEIWQGTVPLPERCFSNLESLIVDGCKFLSDVLPSSCFTNLERLEVRNCSSLKTIFDVKCIKEKMINMEPTLLPFSFSLKILILEQLPNLENVWNEDPDGVLRVKLLQEVHVDRCERLTSLFPASVVKDLVKLENLYVNHCERLMAIVAEDEAALKEAHHDEIIFGQLQILNLEGLPNLRSFYGGSFTFSFPSLKQLSLINCHVMEIFCPATIKFGDAIPLEVDLNSTIRKAFHGNGHSIGLTESKVDNSQEVIRIPSLEGLSFGIGDTRVIWYRESQKLEFQKLQCFQEESDSVAFRFLQMVPNLEKLEVRTCSFEELFSAERPNADYTGVLSHLKGLKLYFLDNLNSIGLEHSWLHPIRENLQTLEVEGCDRLRNLVRRTVSFSSLTHLTVGSCDSLLYLFTSSTAKSLAHLEEMNISMCKSIQEIVSTEGDESHQDEILFGLLQMLKLQGLPKLISLYKGNFTLSFPSLEKLSVINCPKMETFCPGTINANKLSAVEFDDGAVIPLEVDLNSTIRKAFEAR